MRKMLRFASLVVLPALFASCAGQFERDWETAVASYQEEGMHDSAEPFLGPWKGTWESGMNEHTGDLRCLVTPADGEEEGYEFQYHATWGSFFQGGFLAFYEVNPDGKGGFLVSGSKDLGLFGGFDHEGRIEGNRFESTFTSEKGDHGTFEMERP